MPEQNVASEANTGQMSARGPSGDAKGYIRNLALGDGAEAEFVFWFRPTPINQNGGVNYTEMAPMGMSHSYFSYRNTSSDVWSFSLYANRLMLAKEGTLVSDRAARSKGEPGFAEGGSSDLNQYSRYIEDGRRFIEALRYPPVSIAGIVGDSPPICLLVIPGIVTVRCKLINLTNSFTDSDVEGNIIEMSQSVTFREAPLSRITMQDVLENGSFRSWGSF